MSSGNVSRDTGSFPDVIAEAERIHPAQKWVLAPPTGVKRTRTHSGMKSIPIEGADDWEVATMHSA